MNGHMDLREATENAL